MNKELKRRTYLGNLSSKMTNFENAELQSYLRGESKFRYGFHPNKEPMYLEVRSSWMNQEDYENYVNNLNK